MSDNGIKVIKQKTVVAQVMEQIRMLIASGKYDIGDQIPTESELAEMFGIGRSSIREALKVFNYLGILESKAAKGTFVSDLTSISSEALTWAILLGKNELFNMVELRGALEVWSLMKTAEAGVENPEICEKLALELDGALDEMKKAISDNSIEALINADYNFHRIIIESSGNELFVMIYNLLREFMFEEIKATYVIFDSYEFAIDEHRAIIDSIRGAGSANSQQSLKKHISDITGRLVTFGKNRGK